MSKVKEQKVPKFMLEATIYEKGGVVENPFTGDSYELNALELSIYDYTMGYNTLASAMEQKFNETSNPDDLNPKAQKIWGYVRNGLGWFRQHNAKAYMVLLD